jgi:integrase
MATVLLEDSVTDKGSLVVRDYKGRPFYEAKWRDSERAQRKRRLGPAWLELDSAGEWVPRRGRVRSGFLDERRAYPLMASVNEEHEEKLRAAEPSRPEALFSEAVDAWIVYLETEKRVKPSTLAGYNRLLVRPGRSRDLRRGRIMREFEKRLLLDIKTKDARRFLTKLDREDISARTVNSFGVPFNPFAETTKRPEDGASPIETFEPEEILAIAELARRGDHHRRGGYAHSVFSADAEHEWMRLNEQDAALFVISACTGLRLGELLALRWRNDDLRGGVLTVSRSISAGKETSTKSRRARTVPLAAQAIAAF